MRLGAADVGTLSSVIGVLLASATTTHHGSHGFFHSTGFVVAGDAAAVLALVFWLGLASWVHRDARRRIDDLFLRFLATLLGLAPYIGPVVYLLFRPSETREDARSRRVELQALEQQIGRSQPTCPRCSADVEPDYVACPVCTAMLRNPCARCNTPLEPLWQMCPYCATAVGPSQVDLDAALTAETKTIALVDHTIPLVAQAEPRAAEA
jgi:RNA polymerase subunit RPABC4/transcription elongation factor Spt4